MRDAVLSDLELGGKTVTNLPSFPITRTSTSTTCAPERNVCTGGWDCCELKAANAAAMNTRPVDFTRPDPRSLIPDPRSPIPDPYFVIRSCLVAGSGLAT
jgi:hypothetical protein